MGAVTGFLLSHRILFPHCCGLDALPPQNVDFFGSSVAAPNTPQNPVWDVCVWGGGTREPPSKLQGVFGAVTGGG